ncbi:hypothetical protein C2S53_001212 [Perilla frutescens var. hirtella]|uniref:NB-ARC domain-containing protein n=1 Tax=Perilla frutescens var. hirtella TaxID=608512 RepID=A0AAD4PGA5_PERFH|nr:hypothetical protein C2S53_001212 [Perilla frutescens var. hirtella]
MKSENVERRRRLDPLDKDGDGVGLEEEVNLLLEKAILDGRKGLCVATIAGMGGIGKSTLARKIYNHEAVAAEFDCCAWVVVSSELTLEETIKQVMLELQKSTDSKQKVMKDMKELEESTRDKLFLHEKLREMLHKWLVGKQYFIVLDDVWEHAHWESLSSYFPSEQDKSSRLLVTSRNRDVPSCALFIHDMKILDPDNSWELFLKKALVKNTGGSCQEDLENIGREILKRCGGLPLAIIVVGGLLVNQRQSKSKWEKVLKGMDSHLGGSKYDVSGILELSYHNLPPELKLCFLCLSFFKEDATIRAKKLVHIWIAEGLILEGNGESMEDIAATYLDELMNRNLVQVKEMSMDGRVKSCYMHDLLHKLSITKAKEEISFEILTADGNSPSLYKPRHRAIYYYDREKFSYSKNQNKQIRSVLFYGNHEFQYHKSRKLEDVCSPSYWKSFELLKVLEFEDFKLMTSLPESVGALIGLRYLGLRNTGIRRLPRSLRHLKKLEVLDVAGIWLVEDSNVIWKLEGLRHLYTGRLYSINPPRIDTLKNIQTLTYITNHSLNPNHVTELTGLRKLVIRLDANSDYSDLYESLATLQHFVSLSVELMTFSDGDDISAAFLHGSGILHRLTEVKLKFCYSLSGLPRVEDFPPNLSYLTLTGENLDEGSMELLKKLPKLLYLKMQIDNYHQRLVILNGEFPKLKVLFLQSFSRIYLLHVDNDAMPELERLEIYNCENLRLRISMSNHPELQFLTDKAPIIHI